MAKENNIIETTLTQIARTSHSNNLNIDDWNCEFKNWKMLPTKNGKYYIFLDKVKMDCRVVQKPIYRDNPIMWKVILRKEPKANYFIEIFIICHYISS